MSLSLLLKMSTVAAAYQFCQAEAESFLQAFSFHRLPDGSHPTLPRHPSKAMMTL
jgi:hypothetical protein